VSIEFSIPRIPMTINKLMRSHWAVIRREKKVWMDEIRAALGMKGMREMRAWAELPGKIRVELNVHHTRLFDPDNLVSCAKLILDAMKTLRLIADDSAAHIELHVTQALWPEKKTWFKVSKL
jgi:hypothetical protein